MSAAIAAAGGVLLSGSSAEAGSATVSQLTAAGAFGNVLTNDPQASSIPAQPTNPNIMIFILDQFRLPQLWVNSTQQGVIDGLCPNIAWFRKNSLNFVQYYTSAATCTPARSTLLTGFYTRQTAMYESADFSAPALDTRFPTFGTAVASVNPAYSGNVFWEGKWHLSGSTGGAPLQPYGFNTLGNGGQFYPKYPDQFGSPNGTGNEGNNGYPNTTQKPSGSDSAIASDFVNNFPAAPKTPWLSVVSLIDPHDISDYPRTFPPNYTQQPAGTLIPGTSDFYPSFSGQPSTLVYTTADPINSNWNWNDPISAKNISLQTDFQSYINNYEGSLSTESDGVLMLNYYFYLLSLADLQVGLVLSNALGVNIATSPKQNPLTNTVLILTADHGEFGFSHSLRGKGGAAYDEAIRIPLYVSLPLQKGTQAMWQMCSQVDFFRFIVDLAAGPNGGNWVNKQPFIDQAARQTIASYIWPATGLTPKYRTTTIGNASNVPYILHTTDEYYIIEGGQGPVGCYVPNHVTCFRTQSDDQDSNPYTGAKLATYDYWPGGTTTPDQSKRQYEFYDYTNLDNRAELGNDYTNASGPTLTLLNQMEAALNSAGVQTELTGTLQGVYPANWPVTSLRGVKLSDVTGSPTMAGSATYNWAQFSQAQLNNDNCGSGAGG